MISSQGEAQPLARTRPDTSSRWFGLFAWLIWGSVVMLVSARFIGPKLFLIYHYGWARVQRDGLSIVHRRRLGGITWTISNGDRIHLSELEVDLFLFIVPWLTIMAVTVPLLWLLWRLWLKLTTSERAKVAGGNG